jgi:hypothetical protein
MPQKDTLDRAAYTCMLVSYRRLSPQFHFSLSGVTLVYLSQWCKSFWGLYNIWRPFSRDDLGLYLKVLRSSMIELINEDYADFVNLSTNLVGLDTVILRLKEPLLKHQARALDQALKLFLCTGMFLYVRYSFLLISDEFCDSSLLHSLLFRAV